MKKILFFVLMCVSMVACKKHEVVKCEATPTVTISFNLQMVANDDIVRSSTNEYFNIIKEQTPGCVDVTLVNTDLNKVYTCKSNETITIPIGTYEISASIEGMSKPVNNSTSYPIYNTPFLTCDSFVMDITSSTNMITLDAYYDCYVVFALIDECEDCKTILGGEVISFNKYDKYYVCYFQRDNLSVTLVPYDNTEFITTTYDFSSSYDVRKQYIEFGRYYVLHPQKVKKEEIIK